MTRISAHLRANVVAYIALFVALGGTSYAAINLPAGSVGARQLRDHSITPGKFDPAFIGGSVRYWAQFNPQGKLVAASPGAIAGGTFRVRWGRTTGRPPHCVALSNEYGNFNQLDLGAAATTTTELESGPGARVTVHVNLYDPAGQVIVAPVAVAVIC